MRLRDLIIYFFCIIFAVGLLILAASQLDYINSARRQMKLISNEPLANAPPSLAFATIAMGAFRGLVVDILWMRADQLKETGQFFDAKQLAEWITTLQPRFASVWDFHSWNMAYNISVAMPADQPQERWRWVRNGYQLLRDRGIPQNPGSILLYHRLAWIFQHKMGGITDDVHKYYKLQLSLAMKPLLGPQTDEYFQALAAAPLYWASIIQDPCIGQLISALKAADPLFADDDKFVQNYLSLRQAPLQFDSNAFDVIDRFRGTQTLEKFDIFAKASHLRKVWKLNPAFMQQLNRKYGPIDWQDPNKHLPLNWEHPNSHAIYWAARGLQLAGKGDYSIDEAYTDRIIYHSLQGLFRAGKIYIYDVPVKLPAGSLDQQDQTPTTAVAKTVFLRPDLRMFESYNKTALERIAKYKALAPETTGTSIQIGHRNMLINAALSFYQSGHEAYARRIYNQLRRLYPRDEFKVSLVDFARGRLIKELMDLTIKDATEILSALLQESYFRYAIRDDNEAFGREKMAREVYEHYRKRWSTEKTARMKLPDFKMIRYLALQSFMSDELYPAYLRRSLRARIEIERPSLFKQLQNQERTLLEKPDSQ